MKLVEERGERNEDRIGDGQEGRGRTELWNDGMGRMQVKEREREREERDREREREERNRMRLIESLSLHPEQGCMNWKDEKKEEERSREENEPEPEFHPQESETFLLIFSLSPLLFSPHLFNSWIKSRIVQDSVHGSHILSLALSGQDTHSFAHSFDTCYCIRVSSYVKEKNDERWKRERKKRKKEERGEERKRKSEKRGGEMT